MIKITTIFVGKEVNNYYVDIYCNSDHVKQECLCDCRGEFKNKNDALSFATTLSEELGVDVTTAWN